MFCTTNRFQSLYGFVILLLWYIYFFLFTFLGQLSLDEFVDGARKDKWVMKMLQMDVSPGSWINEQRRKSALF